MSIKVYVLPFQRQDLILAAASKQKELYSDACYGRNCGVAFQDVKGA